MKKIKNNQSGFSAVEVILVVVVVGLLAGLGYLFYKNQKKATDTPTTTVAKSTTSPKATPSAADPYTGWKSYCDSVTGSCFKYPADWSDVAPLDAQGVKAFGQNKATTINLEYSEPVTGSGGLGSFATKSLDTLATATADSAYKVVGGYYTTGNVPGYNLIDSSQVQQFSLAVGKTSTISDTNDLLFTRNSNKATFVVHLNNTSGSATVSTSVADSWFSSADGKTALLISKSFYTK